MGGRSRIGIVCLGALLWACGDDALKNARARVHVESLHFGRVAVGTEESRSLVVKNLGRGPLGLIGVERGEGFSEAFSLPASVARTIPGGKKTEIVVRFRPDEVRPYQGELFLLTDDPDHPRIAVSVMGVGDRPQVACAAEVAFGRVVLNTEKVLPLSCVNGGRLSATLHVEGFAGDDPNLFSLVDEAESWEIAPGETLMLGLRFSAMRLGKASATLTVTVPGAVDERQKIALSGEGFASSLVAAPNCIHFGPVSPGQVATGRVIVANGGEQPVNFEGPAIVDGSGVFALASVRSGGKSIDLERLEPGEQAEIEVEFSPASIGRFTGTLLLHNDDPVASHLEVCLTGNGGGADIAVEPNLLDFGTVAVGMKVRKRVFVRNAGTSDGGPLEVFGASANGDGFSLVNPGAFSLAPADAPVPLKVEFEANAEGSFAGTLLVESNDGDQPVFPVPLLATTKALPPCAWEADPPVLRFTAVPVLTSVVLTARLRNVGEGECVFASPRLAPGSATSFSLLPDAFQVALVAPGESVSVAVRFEAGSVGRQSGELLFDVSNPQAPVGSIPLDADVIDGCLRFEPSTVDFGLRRVSCPEKTVPVELVNRCSVPVTLQSAALDGTGHSSGEFEAEMPDLPVTLQHNGRIAFAVTYDPVDDGPDGTLLQVSSTMHPVSLPVFGRGTIEDERTDVFRQHARVPVDILFVIDNSGSMSDKQRAVAAGCEQFMRYAIQQGIDFHIGVTTTGITRSVGGWTDCPGGAYGGEAGRLFPVNRQRARWVTSSMPDAAQVFAENVQVGTCHWLEQGLEAAYRALTSPLVDNIDHPNTELPLDGNLGFYRPEARLSVVIISDEDDQSDRSTSFYSAFFRGLKGPGREHEVSVNVVVGKGCGFAAEEGLRYMDVARATSGMIEPICTSDWGKALGRLAEQSFGYTLRFPLAAVPEGTPRVRVDGVEVHTGWTYVEDENAVVFTEDGAPPPGSLVEITYVPAC